MKVLFPPFLAASAAIGRTQTPLSASLMTPEPDFPEKTRLSASSTAFMTPDVEILRDGVVTTDVDDCTRMPLFDPPPLEENSRRLYLLRHGETDWNAQGKMQGGGFDIQLNESGLNQAERVAQLLKGVPLGVIASSHLSRAVQTADMVHLQYDNEENDATVHRIIDERLGEMRFGHYEGLRIRGPHADQETIETFHSFIERMKEDKKLPWPANGESIHDVEDRSYRAVQELLEDHPHVDHMAIVAHGRTNKILLSKLLGLSQPELDELKQGNTCVNVLDVDVTTGSWQAHFLNYDHHNRV